MTKSRDDSETGIKSLENNIKVYASIVTTLNTERVKLETARKSLLTLKSELNQIRIDTDYVAMIDRLLKNDVVYDSTKINSK